MVGRSAAQSPPAVTIAGRTVAAEAVAERLCAYIAPGSKTVQTVHAYDLPARPHGVPFTVEEVRTTRRFSSRISTEEAQVLIAASSGIDWHDLDPATPLAAADPHTEDGRALYLRATYVYEQLVAGSSQRGIGVAKRHKLLHPRFRHLVPILDSRLTRAYRAPARALAATFGAEHPELLVPGYAPLRAVVPRYTRLTWLAIREDLVSNGDAFAAARAWLVSAGVWADSGLLDDGLDRLSDLRLLDILTWSGG